MWGYFEIIWNIVGVVFFLGALLTVYWCIQDAYREYGLIYTDQQEAKSAVKAEKLKPLKAAGIPSKENNPPTSQEWENEFENMWKWADKASSHD